MPKPRGPRPGPGDPSKGQKVGANRDTRVGDAVRHPSARQLREARMSFSIGSAFNLVTGELLNLQIVFSCSTVKHSSLNVSLDVSSAVSSCLSVFVPTELPTSP